ncbi:MAG: HrcA family transcriptional regulator, partial [Candidatus Omnitrophica bacterium]|nr:HrcA family transcriptional regulator [Candidatus Omnitrophota bacterium]
MLTSRQQHVLSILFSEYIHTAIPVSSQMITRSFKQKVSSATIRNELGELEELGYVTHPHTSAGRIPTNKGYRYFIDHLLEREKVSRDMAIRAAKVFDNQVKSVDDLMQKVSKLLSTLTDEASLVIFPRFEMQRFKKVSLIRMDGARVIAVWVSSSGFVWHGAIELDEVADLEMLT